MPAGRRIFLAYLVFYGATGASLPFLPVFYRDLGLTLEEIGLLTAIQAVTLLALAPLWGGLVDRFPRTQLTLPLAGLVATAGSVGLFLANDFGAALLGSTLLFAGLAGIGPTLDARTLETLGSGARARFGQVRAIGSLGFLAAVLLVGLLLSARGSRALFWVYLPALLATVVVTSTLRRRGATRGISLFRGANAILMAPGVLLLFGGFTVVWTALAGVNAFFSIQIVALGGDPGLVGAAWAFGAAVEAPLMYLFPRLAARVGTERLLALGAAIFATRAFLSAVAPVPLWLVIAAALEGIGFALFFVAAVTLLSARIPISLGGTAQGLLTASAGLATIIGSVAGGGIAGAIGIPSLFAACGVLSLVGAAIVAAAVLGSRGDRLGMPTAPDAPSYVS